MNHKVNHKELLFVAYDKVGDMIEAYQADVLIPGKDGARPKIHMEKVAFKNQAALDSYLADIRPSLSVLGDFYSALYLSQLYTTINTKKAVVPDFTAKGIDCCFLVTQDLEKRVTVCPDSHDLVRYALEGVHPLESDMKETKYHVALCRECQSHYQRIKEAYVSGYGSGKIIPFSRNVLAGIKRLKNG